MKEDLKELSQSIWVILAMNNVTFKLKETWILHGRDKP